jgi:hypothetical protein
MALFGRITTGKIKFNASTNEYNDCGPDGGDTVDGMHGSEIVLNFPGIEVGWSDFTKNAAVREYWGLHDAPDAANLMINNRLPNGKLMARVEINGKVSGRRLLTTSGEITKKALDVLHTLYEAAPEAKQGLLPTVLLGSQAEPVRKQGDAPNWKPTYKITGWVANPWLAASQPVAASTPVATPPVHPVLHSKPIDITTTRQTVAEMERSFDDDADPKSEPAVGYLERARNKATVNG